MVHLDHVDPFIHSHNKTTQILVMLLNVYEILRARTSPGHVSEGCLEVAELTNSNLWNTIPHRDGNRGSAFTSHTFKTFCIEHGIKRVLNTMATPRTNGQCSDDSLAAICVGTTEELWAMTSKGFNMRLIALLIGPRGNHRLNFCLATSRVAWRTLSCWLKFRKLWIK